jgi:hypothetical protein
VLRVLKVVAVLVISPKPNRSQKGAVGPGIAEPRKTVLHQRVVRDVACTKLGTTIVLSKINTPAATARSLFNIVIVLRGLSKNNITVKSILDLEH